ncbi:hypothetical protein [Lysinibacillus piscis]|uniref:Uncharacterized protein n=1 Tax=Lysinibacillus piscis TaxID=2518931 RepID=A0ABQ5NJW3_9BACI|nr:hypothetical protein [Lysinibacillus sp. KH24]GLC88660.1 hypothetical protein LYSBPC_17870 [Lysinibacillus sp. KH24]
MTNVEPIRIKATEIRTIFKEYPIDPIILQKRGAIPGLIAELSYLDQTKSIEYLRIWGEKKIAITPLFDKLCEELARFNKIVGTTIENQTGTNLIG